jgi:hypothetical protein
MSEEAPTIPGELASIHARLDEAEEKRDVLTRSVAHATSALGGIAARLDAGDLRMRFIESGLAENTLVTRSTAETARETAKTMSGAKETLDAIRDAQTAGRVAKKVIGWGGGIAGGLAGIYAAFQSFIKH